jgi:hypothetical protein
MAIRICQAAEHTSADLGLRSNRLSRWTTRLDIGKVLGVDRLRRASGKRAHSRGDTRQRPVVLAAPNGGFFCALMLGEYRELPINRSNNNSSGLLDFPKELFRTSRRWAERRFAKLVYFNDVEKARHFAAFEQWEIFVREVRACFKRLR